MTTWTCCWYMAHVRKFTRKHDRRGPNAYGQLPCISDWQRLPRTLRDHVRSASFLSALTTSLVANLSAHGNGSFQLPKRPLKGFFHSPLAKRDFFVANGRMAADFFKPWWSPSFSLSFFLCSWFWFGGGKVSASARVWWDEYGTVYAWDFYSSNPSATWVRHRRMPRCVVATPPPPLFFIPLPQGSTYWGCSIDRMQASWRVSRSAFSDSAVAVRVHCARCMHWLLSVQCCHSNAPGVLSASSGAPGRRRGRLVLRRHWAIIEALTFYNACVWC